MILLVSLCNILRKTNEIRFRTHRDIIHMCHMKFGITQENDKATLLAALHKYGSGTIKDLRNLFSSASDETWPTPVQRILQICSLKLTKSATGAVDLIQTIPNFEIGHLPVHLISKPQIWEILIPKLNYRELLKVFPTLLKMTDPIISTKMSKSLKNKSLIKDANMHPFEIQPILKLYEKNERYNEYKKVFQYLISYPLFFDMILKTKSWMVFCQQIVNILEIVTFEKFGISIFFFF